MESRNTVEQSCVPTLLQSQLNNGSMTDMNKRVLFFLELLELVRVLAGISELASIVAPLRTVCDANQVLARGYIDLLSNTHMDPDDPLVLPQYCP